MKRKRMRFYDSLYVGESIKVPEQVIRKLKKNIGQLNVYVITAAKGNDLLEIYHAGFLKQAYYKKNPPYIIGIANGYDEALMLVEKIVMENYEKTGNFSLKETLQVD
jgi:hypothetical protein